MHLSCIFIFVLSNTLYKQYRDDTCYIVVNTTLISSFTFISCLTTSRHMPNQLYRSPHSKNPSWASSLNKRTNRTSKDTSSDSIDITSNDEFPDFLNNSNQTTSNNEITSSFLKTVENTEREIDDKETTNENTNV